MTSHRVLRGALSRGALLRGALRRVAWLLALLAALAWSAPARAGACAGVACVSAGPRLLSVDSTRSAILDPLLGSLLGSSVTLSVLDWNAVATADVTLDAFLDALKVSAGALDVDGALSAQLTLAALLDAGAQAAQTDGHTTAAAALRTLAAQLPGLGGTIALGDLLRLEFPGSAYGSARVNLLNIVMGSAQVFNRKHAVTTGSAPVSLGSVGVNLSGLGLGVTSATPTVQLHVQVVEPPVYVCGAQGSTFHTAAVRVKADIDMNGTTVSVLGGNGATLRLTTVTAYVEIARASGSIGVVDAVARAVTLNATPGLARLAVGDLADSVFFDRGRTPGAALPTPAPAKIGEITATLAGFGPVVLDVTARGTGDGTYPLSGVNATGPYPQTVTVGSSSAAVPALVGSLVTSLDVGLTVKAGQVIPALLTTALNTLVDSLRAPARTTVATVLQPTLEAVMLATVDRVLRLLGIGIGEAVLTVNGVNNACTVTVRVYRDAQPDGTPTPDETWDGPTVRVNVTRAGTVTESRAVPAGPGTVTVLVPEGTTTAVLTTGPAVTPQPPAGYVFVNPTDGQATVTVAAATATVADVTLGVYHGDRVTGTAFLDDGTGPATPHDARRQPTEPPAAGRPLVLAGSGGSVAVTTAADGTFTAYVPATWTAVTVAHTGPGTETGITVDGVTTLATDALGTGLRPAPLPTPAGQTRTVQLGLAGRPALSPDASGRTNAPGTVRYTHTLTPGTTGTVTLASTGTHPTAYHLDTDCDGTVTDTERVPVGTVTVDDTWPRSPDGTLRACTLEVQVSVPEGAAPGTTDTALVTAQLTWAGSSVQDSAFVTDTTTVTPPVTLDKTVVNLADPTGTPGTSADAHPGDTLRYCLNVTNPAPDAVTDVTVTDTLTGAAAYAAGSLTVNGAPRTDAPDPDAATYDDTTRTITVTLPRLDPTQTAQVCFDVTVP